jgi:hypothetical protein
MSDFDSSPRSMIVSLISSARDIVVLFVSLSRTL